MNATSDPMQMPVRYASGLQLRTFIINLSLTVLYCVEISVDIIANEQSFSA